MAAFGAGLGVRGVERVKLGRGRPIDRPMRVSRIAPLLALVVAAASAAGAVLASRAADWHAPQVLALLFVIAAVADRFQITTRTGTVLVGSLPTYVLTAVVFGPAPGAAVAVAASLTQPRKAGQLVVGNLAVFATFPLLTGLAARAVERWLPDSTSLWTAIAVAAMYLLAWALNVALVLAYMKLLRGRDMLRELLSLWRALLS